VRRLPAIRRTRLEEVGLAERHVDFLFIVAVQIPEVHRERTVGVLLEPLVDGDDVLPAGKTFRAAEAKLGVDDARRGDAQGKTRQDGREQPPA
jgi:hypothetical protein